MEFDCGICLLRPWRPGDEASLARHADSRQVWLNLRDRFPHPYTLADAVAWVQLASRQSPITNLAIEVEGCAVGGLSLMLQQDVERVSAEIGYWLGEELWGRGVMTAAVRTATDYAFSAFDLTRVFAVPFVRNPASVRVLEKVGYEFEGLLRRSAIKDGVILDQAMYAVTDQDHRAARS